MIVGLIGHARSGKDTVANRLVTDHGYARVAFADLLREVLLDADPYVDACVDNDYEVLPFTLSEVVDTLGWEEAKSVNPEVRRIMQNFGQAIREVEPNFWLRAGMRKALEFEGRGTPVVISDVRYRNEALAIRSHGGVLVRVTRPGFDGANGHVSEHELDDFVADHTINNNGTLPSLIHAVDWLAHDL